MVQHVFRSFLLCSLVALTPAAHANTVIFSDSFSTFTFTGQVINPVLPVGWTIGNLNEGGAINVLGRCPGYSFDVLPDFDTGDNNCYIDLDGNLPPFNVDTALPAGILTKQLYLNANHTYRASFDLAGNQVYLPLGDTVYVDFGSTSKEFYLGGDEGFTTFEVLFTPSASANYLLTFKNSNLDAYGALLDNVVVTDTSVPAPIPLLGAGVAFSYQRRLRVLRQKLHGHPPLVSNH